MSAADDEAQMGASPYSAGGGGTVLEHRYGAILLASLLVGDPLSELGDDATPESVQFQASACSPVDDLFVVGRTPDGGERRVSIGVRRAPSLVTSEEASARLLVSYLRIIVDNWAEVRAGRWRLSLAVVSPNTAVQQVRDLAEIARSTDAGGFRAEVARPRRTNQGVRNRLTHIDALVLAAAEQAGIDTGEVGADVLTWRLLFSLRPRELRLEGDETDRTIAVGRLRLITPDGAAASADSLFARLTELAGRYAPAGTKVTYEVLRRDLSGTPLGRSPSQTRARVSADAILRGPVAHLGLAQRLREADEERDSDPAAAAAGYGEIANALFTSPYAPLAARVRAQQADALRAAGDAEGAMAADLAVMAAALPSGEPWEALIVAQRLAHQHPEGPDHLVRAINSLVALAAYEHDPNMTLDTAAEMFDASQPQDPYGLQTAALFAEHAVASRRLDLVNDRVQSLAAVAEQAGLDDAGRLAEARIRACIADATGDWDELARRARTGYPNRVAVLLLARHGRHLAMAGQPDAAIDRYYEAIEKACEVGAYADAADWLFAIRLIRLRCGIDLLAGDINDFYRLALALRVAGNDSVIPEPFSARERVLSQLNDNHLPDAMESLRRYRWRSVTIASLADEREADTRLGELYAAADEPLQAIGHFVAAGDADRLKKLAEALQEATLPLPVPPDFRDRPSWVRAASFTIAGAAADLLSDADALEWSANALTEIAEDRPVPALTSNPSLDACTAFARLAEASTQDQANQFLDLASAWLERAPNQYRNTDVAHAEALVRIAEAHPQLRSAAVDQMCRALILNEQMAGIVLSQGQGRLRAESSIVVARCAPAAGEGNVHAALAIVLADADMTSVIPLARQRLDAVAPPDTHTPDHPGYIGGWEEAAVLCSALDPADRARLANAMIVVIENRREVTRTRNSALRALGIVGRSLEHADRERCFPVAHAAALGDLEGTTDDETFPGGPLDRIRVTGGPSTLRFEGLRAAAELAHVQDQYTAVVTLAQELMPHASQHEANRIARALDLLPANQAGLEPATLAAHGSEWIRALAATVWCSVGGQPARLGLRLAADPSGHVRRALAINLPSQSAYDELRAILLNDVRRSVRAVLRN